MNRTLYFSMPDILLDYIGITIETISKSNHKDIYKRYQLLFKLMENTYYKYKE